MGWSVWFQYGAEYCWKQRANIQWFLNRDSERLFGIFLDLLFRYFSGLH